MTSHEQFLIDRLTCKPIVPVFKEPVYPRESESHPILAVCGLWDPGHMEINRYQRGRVPTWSSAPVAPELSPRPVT